MRTVAILSVLALAACSGGGAGNGAVATSGGRSAPTGGATASGLNIADACAALPKDAVAQAMGRPVRTAELKDVMPDSGNGMAGSNCVFDFGEARLVQAQLNKFPDGVDAGTTMQGTRDMLTEQGSKPSDEVPGLGIRAFYIPGSSSLLVQLNGSTQLTLTANRLTDVPDMKAKLIALARRMIG